MPTDILAELGNAAKDLRYRSEADEPFEVVSWGESREMDASTVCKQAGHGADAPIKSLSIEEFFRDLTKDEDWHDETERGEVQRYQRLFELVKTRLRGARVFHIGRIQIDIFIIGQTQEGRWAGLRTKAVET